MVSSAKMPTAPAKLETNEEALDRAVIIAQEARLRASQTPRLPVSYNPATPLLLCVCAI